MEPGEDREDAQVVVARMRLSTNLALLAFPFLYGATMALAVVARRSRWLAAAGLACSFPGLTAMLVNGVVDLTLVNMSGIGDRGQDAAGR